MRTAGIGRCPCLIAAGFVSFSCPLALGGYFPMFDHALQVGVGFEELCRCMAELHRICGSDIGEFPRP